MIEHCLPKITTKAQLYDTGREGKLHSGDVYHIDAENRIRNPVCTFC